MNWLKNIWNLLFGGGTVIAAVDDGLKLADDITQEVHDANQRTAGHNEVVAKDNKASAEASHAAAQAMVDTTDASTLDDLRRDRF